MDYITEQKNSVTILLELLAENCITNLVSLVPAS